MGQEDGRLPAGCLCAHARRREVILAGVGMLAGAAVAHALEPNERRPRAGDILVHSTGPRKGQPVRPEDLPLDGPPQLAFPMDPSGLVLDGLRFNEVVVVRVEPEKLDPEAKPGSADGIVVYSAICTHEACSVNMWNDYEKMLVCSCHGSMFDPRARARVVFGPAQRRLAQLPIRVEEGKIVVAGPFQGRLGPQRAS
ncbi:MAG: Rieske 2Fe-2S domain-containing protein [Geminicoccaceae bacterium]|nr:Rieske 2Fe-2S domain-containing protein [Geminicoccaceae bacterium]